MKVWAASAFGLTMAGAALGGSMAVAQGAAPPAAVLPVVPQDNVATSLKEDVRKALFSTESFDVLSVRAQKTATGLWVLYVAAKDVGWNSGTTDASDHAEATVVAGWYDAENKLMGNLAQEESFKRVVPGGDAVYSMQVMVPAGAARLRFVVRDARNGRMGTVDVGVQGIANSK